MLVSIHHTSLRLIRCGLQMPKVAPEMGVLLSAYWREPFSVLGVKMGQFNWDTFFSLFQAKLHGKKKECIFSKNRFFFSEEEKEQRRMEVKLLMENGCLDELNQKIRTQSHFSPVSKAIRISKDFYSLDWSCPVPFHISSHKCVCIISTAHRFFTPTMISYFHQNAFYMWLWWGRVRVWQFTNSQL